MLQAFVTMFCLFGGPAIHIGTFSTFPLLCTCTHANSSLVQQPEFERDAAILMRCRCSEEVKPSQIVGIRNQCMSLNLNGCERWGVVSSKSYFDHDRSLYIGNELDGTPVVLMGHAPVLVSGPVEIGDFIVPSGQNDGMGVGISVAKWSQMKARPRVLGMARSSHPFYGVHLVDTALGFWDKSLIQFLNRNLAKHIRTDSGR